jgi:uncharacterized membrane protein
MGLVRVALTLPASVHEAESCWYETSRWPFWVDGLERIVAVAGDWPRAGATLRWESGPAGRGNVVETVLAHEPLAGQTVEVEDDSIRGSQVVTFTPVDGSVEVALSLDYEIKRRSIVTPLIDALFIRRAMSASLRATLTRFGAELDAARRSSVG